MINKSDKRILEADRLFKRYGNKIAVNKVTVSIKNNEVVGLLGPNGAGKSTSFYILAGLIKADTGKIILNGSDITNYPMHKRAKLGLNYLPQESSVFRELSTKDNLIALIEQRDDLDKKQKSYLLDKLTEEFGLKGFEHVLGRNLSGGERRRLEIARALTSDPTIILLDEPFAGIDPISLSEIKAQIKQLKTRNIGILITDHNVRETLDICDRAYIVNEGQIIANGNVEEILSNEKVKQVYLGKHFT